MNKPRLIAGTFMMAMAIVGSALAIGQVASSSAYTEDNRLQGIGEDGNGGKIHWAYEFVPIPAEGKNLLTSDEKGRKLYSNDEWIVTSTGKILGDGVGESLVSFWNAKSLKKEFQVRVPNGVQHLDWSSDRKQFLLVTGKGFKWSLGGSHQGLVLIDPAKKLLEIIRFNKKPDNAVEDPFEIKPVFWGKRPSELSVNGQWNDAASLTSGATIKPQNPAFKDLEIKVIQSPSKQLQSSLDEHDSSGLNFLGIALQKPSQGGDESVVLYSEKTIAAGDKKETRILRSPDNGKLMNVDLLSLKMESYQVPFSNVEKMDEKGYNKSYLDIGLFPEGEILLKSLKGVARISHNSLKEVTLPRSLASTGNQSNGGPPRDGNLTYSDDGIYIGSLDLSKDHPLSVLKITSDGKSTNAVNEYDAANLKSMGGLGPAGGQFTLYPERKSFSVKLGDEGVWHEYSWVNGKEISPSHEDNARSVYFRKYGAAPDGWEISRSLDDAGAGFADYSVQVRNLNTGQSFQVANGPNVGSSPLVLEMRGNQAMTLVSGTGQTELATLDLKNGKTTSVYKWNWVSPRGQNFHVDGGDGLALYDPVKKWLFIPSDKGFSVFDPFGSKPSLKVFDLLFEGHDQFAIVLPNGCYAGTPGCEKLLKLQGRGGMIDSYSLAPWRNRPAEVNKALGGDPKDADLLAKVTERWLKRIGFDPSTPEPAASEIAKISVPQMPSLWASSPRVSFPIEVTVGGKPLKEVTVRVNGVLQKSFSGKELSSFSGGSTTLNASVDLAQGQNWIEVTATDAKGRPANLERFRTILPKAGESPKRYIVAMGCSEYDRSDLNLQYAAKDAGDVLKAISKAGGRECKTLLLINKEVGPEALEKIKTFVADSKESDEVILFCAGHGLLDEHLDYVYAGHQIDPEHPGQTGIHLDALLESIGTGKSLKRLVLMDTCQSGSVGEKEEMKLASASRELPHGVRAVKSRAMKVVGVSPMTGGDQQRFIEEMFLLPGQHRGINIIGASGGAEYAMESDKWNNGVFTSALIEGLRDQKADMDHRGRISVSDLKTYLAQRVPELTGGAQKPSVVAFEQDQDFDLVGKIPPVPDSVMNQGSQSAVATSSSSTEMAVPASAGVMPTGYEVNSPNLGQKFVNSLGQRFVPIPGTPAYFCIWNTRVSDYGQFVKETGRAWKPAGFTQKPDHPAVRISYQDATAFCGWLTQKEHAMGKLPSNLEYRLPKDLEWSTAAGITAKEMDGPPAYRSGGIPNCYPWGSAWPPPKNAGNYDPSLHVDSFPFTSPSVMPQIGGLSPNKYGLLDMSGNVYQWILEDFDQSGMGCLRGCSWADEKPECINLTNRLQAAKDSQGKCYGFRCVIAPIAQNCNQQYRHGALCTEIEISLSSNLDPPLSPISGE